MAVVTKYAKSAKDPNSVALPEAVFGEGRMRTIISGPVAVANGDSANSRIYFGKISSNAIMLPQSILYHTSITGLTDFDIGIERDGTAVDIDLFADGLTLASAGNKQVTAALATGSIGKRVWELVAGLTSDPNCEYDLVGTLKADAGAAGTVELFAYYAKK